VNRKPSESTDAEFEIVDGDDDMEVEEVDSDEWDDGGDPIPVTECVFCGHHSKDLEKNLIHMNEKHCFFLPDAEYCVDLEGMMEYLGKKVSGHAHVLILITLILICFRSVPDSCASTATKNRNCT
jgi:pre-60S factor REI1